MQKQTFHFEIQDLIVQFLAAFNNVIISRYEGRSREPSQNIQVRYVYAPKQRVLMDLINPGQNLVLPVVAISIGGVSRDENRVFSKNTGFLTPSLRDKTKILSDTPYFRTPVPINVTINMSILTKNQIDMDQILSNFIPYSNPYIVISWKIPEVFSPNYDQEIRSEVLWDGNIALTYPVEINNTQKAQCVADTSFTIKGWLFPYKEKPIKNIFKIDANFFAVSSKINFGLTDYFSFSALGIDISEDKEITFSNTVSVTGYPQITDIFLK